MCGGVNGGADAVVHAIADYRPAVVCAACNPVEFIAALRAVFGDPQGAARAIQGHALRVAVAVTPDLRQCLGVLHERVVGRYATIVVQTDDHAVMIRELLCGMRGQVACGRYLAVAHADEQIALLVKGQAGTVVPAAAGLRHENIFHVAQCAIAIAAANDRRGGFFILQRLRVGQIEQTIAGKVRVQHNIQ